MCDAHCVCVCVAPRCEDVLRACGRRGGGGGRGAGGAGSGAADGRHLLHAHPPHLPTGIQHMDGIVGKSVTQAPILSK